MGIQRKFNRNAKRSRMRRLAFEGQEGRERWDICYGAMLVNPEGYARETRRVARRVLEKLEAIGVPVEDKTLIAKFEYDGKEPREVEFEEAEFKMLREVVDSIKWTRQSIVMADKTIEWLDGIQESKKEQNRLAPHTE